MINISQLACCLKIPAKCPYCGSKAKMVRIKGCEQVGSSKAHWLEYTGECCIEKVCESHKL